MVNIIVLEGPDNSGKSVLARYIAEQINFPLIISEGSGKANGEINERIRRYNRLQTAVFDRHPCVSQVLYDVHVRHQHVSVNEDLLLMFYDLQPLFIYCRGRGLEQHIVKEHDTQEHLKAVEENHPRLCSAYDEWAKVNAHVFYRVGDSMRQIINLIRGTIA